MNTSRTPPNVVILVSHDTGRELSPYGRKTVHTPRFERLAKDSVVFSQCFSTAPLCSPSRASLFTGRYPHQTGVNGLCASIHGWSMNPGEPHAARLFSAHGYETVLCQGLHETEDWGSLGWDRMLLGPLKEARRDLSVGLVPDLVDGWLTNRPKDRAFYLQIGCHETHREFDAYGVAPDASLGVSVPPYIKDLPEVRLDLETFQGAVKALDTAVGRLIDVLTAHGILDSTLVVVTTDHGIDYPGAKGCFFDAGIETMLFMRFPHGGWRTGVVDASLVSQVDILPTVLEACDIPVPASLAGRSFLPLLKGQPHIHPRKAVFAEKTYHDCYDPTRMIRTQAWKYVRYFDNVVINDLRIASIERSAWHTRPLFRKVQEDLYDLKDDPGETRNLADEPGYEAIREALRRELRDWMRETDDPLLMGPVQSPVYLREIADLQRA